jgi:hypothetical protein
MLRDKPVGGSGKLPRLTRLCSNLGGGDGAPADLAEDGKPDGSDGRAGLGTSGLGENLCRDDSLDLTLSLASGEAARDDSLDLTFSLASGEAARDEESISILISRGL